MSIKTTALAFSTYAIQSGEMWAMPWKNNGLQKTKTPLSAFIFLNYRIAVKINWEVQIHGTLLAFLQAGLSVHHVKAKGP